MSKNNKNIQTLLFSATGIVVMAVLMVAINVITNHLHLRKDLTEDKLYTLSDGSKQIIKKLKSPVTLRFYCTRSQTEMPIYLKSYAKRIEDLLKEYQIAGGGKLKIEKYDPSPDSDAEDAASLDGIDGQTLQTGEKIYLGLAVNSIDETLSIPFLSPNNESTLEYDITRLILRVANPSQIVVGIMSTLPVMGDAPPPNVGYPQRQAPTPWVFVSELKKDFDVREIEIDAANIPEDISVLVVVHPKEVSDQTQFAIDQYVLGGGKLIAFVDPMSAIESQFAKSDSGRPSPPGSSTLKFLFDAWGVEFDTQKIIIDMKNATEVGGQGGQRQTSPSVLSLDSRSLNVGDIIASSLDKVIFAYSGAFTGEVEDGLTKTVLVHTSKQSQLVESYKAQLPEKAIAKDFRPDDKEYALAIRLVGNFKTAFENGAPAGEGDDSASQESEYLKESAESGAVILVADADMIYDDFWVRKTSFFGQTIHQVFSDNNNLLQNSAEQLSGDSSLISIRSRGVTNRPFLIVKGMQLEAEKKYKKEISDLEEELSEAQQKIGELNRTKKDQSQRFIMSKEQARELEKFQEKKVEVNQRLKELRKQLRKDVDSLEIQLKLINIASVPAGVCVFGLMFAFIRKRRMAGK